MTTDLLAELLACRARCRPGSPRFFAESADPAIQAAGLGWAAHSDASHERQSGRIPRRYDIDPSQIRSLGEDDDPQIRARAARSPHMPLDLLAWLAEDEARIVRRAVAEHANATAKILAVLAKDYSWSNEVVRLAVVRHPNVSVDTLEYLAGDRSARVRQAVLAHANRTDAGPRAHPGGGARTVPDAERAALPDDRARAPAGRPPRSLRPGCARPSGSSAARSPRTPPRQRRRWPRWLRTATGWCGRLPVTR